MPSRHPSVATLPEQLSPFWDHLFKHEKMQVAAKTNRYGVADKAISIFCVLPSTSTLHSVLSAFCYRR